MKSGSLERMAYRFLEIAGMLKEFQMQRKVMPSLFLEDAEEMGRAHLFRYLGRKASLRDFFRRLAEREGGEF